MTRVTFYACEAWLSSVLGERVCEVWLQNPKDINYDKTKTMRLDLGATPSRSLANIEVDDFIFRADTASEIGKTTLGPRWPGSHRGTGAHAAAAAVWLETSKWQAAKKLMSHYPPVQGTDERQWASILDAPSNDRTTWRRFSGYLVEVKSIVGQQAELWIWGATDEDASPKGWVPVALNDAAALDLLQPPSLGNPKERGILFFDWKFMAKYPQIFVTPKLPISEGGSTGSSAATMRASSPAEPSFDPWSREQYLASSVAKRGGSM